MMGFRIDEAMRGHHTFADGQGPPGRHPFTFRLTWGPDALRTWLNPRSGHFLWQEVRGELDADGLCHHAPCAGTLALQYHHGALMYDFDTEVDGRVLRFHGEKTHLRPWNLPWSHTHCFGTLTELRTGTLVSTSYTRFYLRDLPTFLGSLRAA